MDRWGCIRFPDLPLQVALLRQPKDDSPFAVVRDERPSSPLLFVNPAAQAEGLRPGMLYTAALSVVPHLHVDTVTPDALAEVRRAIVELLAEWSPQIEPCTFDAEVFWINASGLSALHGAPEQWGAKLRDHLSGLGYRIDLVIGFSRRGSYVLVRSWRRSAVVANVLAERRAVAISPVAALPLSWHLYDLLDKLDVTTVAEFDHIPRGELIRRLDRDTLVLLSELSDVSLPIQPVKLAVPTVKESCWDDAVTDTASLFEALSGLLSQVLEGLRPRARLIETLTFELIQEDGERTEVLKPAQATANTKTWARLLELRLESLTLTAGVVGVRLDTVSVPLPAPASDLFERPPRDLSNGEKALALIRARWGNDTVVQAVLTDNHAPEQSFVWQPVQKLTPPQPISKTPVAVRRIFNTPRIREDREGDVIAGPFVHQKTVPEDGQGILRRHWFVRQGREVLWLRQDGWAPPNVMGVVD